VIVTFSGIDGSGKTTLSRDLAASLIRRGIPARVGRPAYEANDADWLDHLAGTLCATQGLVLVCDRYIFDVLAQALHMKAHARALLDAWNEFPVPALSYFVDIPPAMAFERLLQRSGQPIHRAEQLEELETLRAAYDGVIATTSWMPRVLDPSPEVEGLAADVERAWRCDGRVVA
jgi:thymidylate kinase